MTALDNNNYFLGRQPIIGRDGELVAYELLFRSGTINVANVLDDVFASAAVIQYAFSDLGIQKVLGEKRGFINLSSELLMNDIIEVLPKEFVVLEILETISITPAMVHRCQQLKGLGYLLALDDIVELTRDHEAILPLISVVKIDMLAISKAKVIEIKSKLQSYTCSLLAEKVSTPEQYEFCRELGFDLFQGYFFERPTILYGKAIQPSTMVLLNLLSLILSDAETNQLEDALKQSPDLAIRLLKMSNTVMLRAPNKISTLREAIIRMGRTQLSRWMQIMVFAQQGGTNKISSNPIVHTAAARGYIMEGLAKKLGWVTLKDRAFMVGMLSLMDALFAQPLADLIEHLNLDDSLQSALLIRDGKLGTLLSLVEANEHGNINSMNRFMERLEPVNYDLLNRLQIKALEWADSF
ncbi:EAL domain-containing protein [Acidithiobacillus sp.]|uniref:EAL and HDOD domain-containing protein n=1 Tax=Acidithiobacillus sp. TaxID=1872118 RepID=UPI002625C197|nr:EAL domain-containing protein [Acidithiobacillus sp.]